MKKFPTDFVWGAATSSYQIEGAWLQGGKGLSIWDAFCHTPGKIKNDDTGDVACGHYHRFAGDVKLMAEMGLQAYRFSLSWPRIQPSGQGRPNPEGIRFYSNLIDALLAHSITPWVTLYHWDLPLALQMEYDGWLNPKLANFFADYAAVCFEVFGDRVKNWLTLNEPWCSAVLGHGIGIHAPGRISSDEPYLAAHTLLRAHALAVEKYRIQFQPRQKGRIAITNNCDWREPLTDSEADRQAAQRAVEFFLGWFADPVFKGDYPAVMRECLGDRLPHFTDAESALLKGSADFFGLNHYSTMYAAHTAKAVNTVHGNNGTAEDQGVVLSSDPDWEKTQMEWNIVPWGFRKLLQWIDARYDSPSIYVTENGCAMPDIVENGKVNDSRRIAFLDGYLSAAHEALAAKVKLQGYFAWSFMDNFEWGEGYSKRFGLHHVDYATGRRTPKASAKWYAEVIKRNGL
ncbi:GH1 family beta-glucosidase [candidate division KSB1 bacterium]|nr:GH1 family beta-glucosidase [candidate division KSB1 bacterium]